MFTQGYIGVTKDFKNRMYDHMKNVKNYPIVHAIKKYGWDGLIKKIILIAENDYCFDIEAKLRPTSQIGWNINQGGEIPPDRTGKQPWNKGLDTPENVKEKQRQAKLGTVGNRKGKENSPEHRAKIKATKALNPYVLNAEQRQKISLRNIGTIQPLASCLYCRYAGGSWTMNRWHFNRCKFKGVQ
jgi:hypothetical protein